MKRSALGTAAAAAVLYASSACAQACGTVLTPTYQAPVLAGGWTAQLIVTGLKKPRGIIFDEKGALLVVEQNAAVRYLTFKDSGGTCLEVAQNKVIINSSTLNHGIAFSNDNKTLYASDSEAVYAWSYDSTAGTIGDANTTIVRNMSGSDHTSRTLLMSQKSPGTLLVSRGSSENVDLIAQQITSGHSQIRAFQVNNMTGGPYDYASGGKMLGWGLRNSVGVAEEPLTGGLYSVENSVDQITREGVDVHEDSPGEEMNFHGYLNGSAESQGGNYGYPDCFAIWSTDLPDLHGMVVGNQFAPSPSATLNDSTCNDERVQPRLTFEAHMAPLDIKFRPDGSEAYVTFHGSWDRTNPAGYKLSSIAFANGQPVEPPSSNTSTRDIMSNADNSACPGSCFRPVGLAIDAQGRLFMSSDATGEIYVLQQAEMSATMGDNMTTSTTASSSGTLVTSTGSSTPNAAPHGGGYSRGGSFASSGGEGGAWGIGLTLLVCLITGFGPWISIAAR